MEALDVVLGIFNDIIGVVFAFSPQTSEVMTNLFAFFATSIGAIVNVIQELFAI